MDGWFAEDFTLAEIAALFAREPDPAAHPQNARLDGKEPVLTLADVLQIARDGCVRTGRTIGVCARLTDPARYADLGPRRGRAPRRASSTPRAMSQRPRRSGCRRSSREALRAFGRLSRVRRMLLIDAGAPDAATLTTTAGLGDIKAFAEAIGPDQALLIDPAAATFPAPTTLALDAHNAGLAVFSRTARRAERSSCRRRCGAAISTAPAIPNGRGDVGKLLVALFSDGVDGVATDLPADAARARSQAMSALHRGHSGSGLFD